MSTAAILDGFAADPIATHSAQFPLSAPFDRISDDEPSAVEVRPWALRGMRSQPAAAEAIRTVRYDHRKQVATDESGRPLLEAGPPTVKNKTSLDGDEGPSEDFSYDFVPDEPFPVWMSVLILAEERDPSADAMVRALAERDTIVHRVDTAWFPGQLSVSAELTGGRWSGQLRTPYRTVDLDGITAVWFRSPKAYRFATSMTAAERGFANLEAKYGLGGVLTSLPVLWINHPARLADAAYKPVQLALAHRCGLRVAETMVTNDPVSVRQFAGRGKTVTKVLGSNSIVERGGRKLAYTRVLDAVDLGDLRGIDQTVHLFQRWVPKAHEARMIVVGDKITTVAIHAGSPQSHIDWRTDYDNLRYELIEPPAPVAAGVRGLLTELGLVYGALDFVIGPQGWTFLELNAGGQFGWLEDATGVPIIGQLADLLAEGTTA